MISNSVTPTPYWASARRSLRLPAFWLLIGLLLIGAWRIAVLLTASAARYPIGTGLAVLLFALYAVPFVLVVRSLDFFEREPPLLILSALAWGGLIATAVAIPGDKAVYDLLAKLVSPAFAAGWGPALAAPVIEELLKTLGVVVIVLVARAQINSVVDGLVYGAFVGLGFQVVEDILYATNAVSLAGGADQVSPVIATFLLRGFLAGLWSHTLFSALAGAGVAYLVMNRNRQGLMMAGAALSGAWAFHFLWNSPWLSDGFGYGALGVLAGLFIKGIPAALVILLLIRAFGRDEADYYLRKLVGDRRVATDRELLALASGRTRAAARKLAEDRCGRSVSLAVGRLQRAQAGLALELSRDGRRAARYRAEALALRDQLTAWGHPEAYAPASSGAAWWVWLAGGIGAVAFVVLLAVAIRALGGD
jgi:RsiW-degrading membrane proteinase PrsW (M82 family)